MEILFALSVLIVALRIIQRKRKKKQEKGVMNEEVHDRHVIWKKALRLNPRILFLLILLLLFGIVLSNDLSHFYQEGLNVKGYVPSNWQITGETHVKNEQIILSENVIIYSGGKLFLSKTTINWNCTYDGEFFLLVKGGGQLVIGNDSLLTSIAGYGFNITTEPGSTLSITNSTIEYGGYSKPELWIPAVRVETENAVFSNITFNSLSNVGIEFSGSSGGVVQGVKLSDVSRGIIIESSQNLVIIENWINNMYIGIELSNTENITIKGNSFNNIGAFAISTPHDSFSPSTRLTIMENTINNTRDGSIYLRSVSYPRIENNFIDNSDWGAIFLTNAPFAFIRGNTIRNISYCALSIEGDMVTNNSFDIQNIEGDCGGNKGSIIIDNVFTQIRDQVLAIRGNINLLVTRNTFSKFLGNPRNLKPTILISSQISQQEQELFSSTNSYFAMFNFYLNNIFVNTTDFQISDNNQNYNLWDVASFDNNSHGNYWLSYSGIDDNEDKIGDTPFIIDSLTVDKYPIINPVQIGDTGSQNGPWIFRTAHEVEYNNHKSQIKAAVMTYALNPIKEIIFNYSINSGVNWKNITVILVNGFNDQFYGVFCGIIPDLLSNMTIFLRIIVRDITGMSTSTITDAIEVITKTTTITTITVSEETSESTAILIPEMNIWSELMALIVILFVFQQKRKKNGGDGTYECL